MISPLLWPGEQRAGALFDDAALLAALLDVESAWLAALIEFGLAPGTAAGELRDLVSPADLTELGARSEDTGNPVVPLVSLLRARATAAGRPQAAAWLHRGLTSQDVLDTALMCCTRDTFAALRDHVRRQVGHLGALAQAHRDTPMVARTLTQHALPYTFGAKVAVWLRGILDSAQDAAQIAATLPAQFGGAAGTAAATVYLAAAAGSADPVATALAVGAAAAGRLGLADGPPWHTIRTPMLRCAAALGGLVAGWAHLANDVLTLARPEIGELTEPAAPGRGGSSTMPQKVNPVLSVLIRRAGLTAPGLLGGLQLAASQMVDERADGAWHAEWQPLAQLCRHTLIAADQVSELVGGLRVDTQRMADNLAASGDAIFAERQALVALTGTPPPLDDRYLGAAGELVDATCARARSWLAGQP